MARDAPNLTLVPAHAGATVEMVIPVFNEEHVLAASVATLHEHMVREFTFPFRITIADNASVDATPAVGRRLARELEHVEYLRLERKGRGLALRAAWSASEAEVLAYMDVDLSTDLELPGGPARAAARGPRRRHDRLPSRSRREGHEGPAA